MINISYELMLGVMSIVGGIALICILCSPSVINIVVTGVSIILIIMSFVAANYLNHANWQYDEKPYVTQYMGALNDTSEVSGTFYVRRGNVGETLYYQYLKKTSDGGYYATKVRADHATVYETDSEPRVEWYHRNKTWCFFKEKDYYARIYIPTGSIENSYVIDLQ